MKSIHHIIVVGFCLGTVGAAHAQTRDDDAPAPVGVHTPVEAGVMACETGDDVGCQKMAESDSELAWSALIEACRSGTSLACKHLAQSGRASFAGETLRHVGIGFLIVGAVGALMAAVMFPAGQARRKTGSGGYFVGSQWVTWETYERDFWMSVSGLMIGIPLVIIGAAVGIPCYVAGYNCEQEILERAGALSVTFVPRVIETPTAATSFGLDIAVRF